MKQPLSTTIHRRDLLRAVITGAAAAAVADTAAPEPAAATSKASTDKRRARYRADSAEVRDFYRVNRYPRP
jgi:hypothetical protein